MIQEQVLHCVCNQRLKPCVPLSKCHVCLLLYNFHTIYNRTVQLAHTATLIQLRIQLKQTLVFYAQLHKFGFIFGRLQGVRVIFQAHSSVSLVNLRLSHAVLVEVQFYTQGRIFLVHGFPGPPRAKPCHGARCHRGQCMCRKGSEEGRHRDGSHGGADRSSYGGSGDGGRRGGGKHCATYHHSQSRIANVFNQPHAIHNIVSMFIFGASCVVIARAHRLDRHGQFC
mmetsp:Transcript_38384/g.66247  ORF Transcript_38384/g.66247 Transcript_38384/m.66247 type:complete len:226 (-) Transcript_38384:2993-3670(-)